MISGQNGTGSVLPLEEAVAGDEGETVRAQLGSLVASNDPFVARNDAAWQRGTLVHVPANTVLETPVRIDVKAPEGGASASRTLIVLEDGAEADVIETWTGGAGGLLNAVVEIRVGAGATLRYSTLQQLDESAWVFATQRAEAGRDASIDWTALGFGSARGKVRMETNLAGQGAEGRVTGAYAGRGEQHLDYDTTQEHAAPHTTSDLAFRGILGDSSTAVWRGMIRVDPGAQQTDAFQESRNLLLTKQAHADAIPGLEIEANDVRCTHAAAVAQIDAEQLYYLRSRGLPDEIRPPPGHRGLPRRARRAHRREHARRDRAGARAAPRRSTRLAAQLRLEAIGVARDRTGPRRARLSSPARWRCRAR